MPHAQADGADHRLLDGGERLQQFVVAGISTVLITRAYLQLTGHPKIGGGGLHLAHVLWGGLFMLSRGG